MLTNGKVTIKRGDMSAVYTAHVFERRGRASEDGGAIYSNEMIVRIPTDEPIDVKVDDWVVPDYAKDERTERRKVIQVTANLVGLNPHYKLVCV